MLERRKLSILLFERGGELLRDRFMLSRCLIELDVRLSQCGLETLVFFSQFRCVHTQLDVQVDSMIWTLHPFVRQT